MLKKYLLIIPVAIYLFMITAVSVTSHPFYFSVSAIKINAPKKSIEISCKLFTDDLENALLQLNKNKIDLASSIKDNKVKVILFGYLSERFKIWINGIPLTLNFVGFEVENDVTWCYLEGESPLNLLNNMKLKNMLLYDFLPDQTNLVQFEYGETAITEKLSNPDKELNFEFKVVK